MTKTFLAISAAGLLAGCNLAGGAVPEDPALPEGIPVSAEGVVAPEGLSTDEKLIWDSLTPSAKLEASDFIAKGGTLAEFVAL